MSVYHRPGRRHDVFLPFPSFSPPHPHHDGLIRVRVSYLLLARSISPSLSSLSLAFTLADPHSWAAPSPLDSPDPIGVLDSILYPPFEREIVSLLFLPRPPRSLVYKLPLTISAPILPVAGSTSQTSTSCLLILRPLTSSLCPSSLMSHSTTTHQQIRCTMLPIRFSVSHSHAHSPKDHVHAHQVPVLQC